MHGDSGWLWVLASNRFFGFNDRVSERPRRWTRNPLGSARRASNPLAVDTSELRGHGWHFLAQRINGLQESMLGCGASKHHSSRVPALRNPSFLCAPGSQVFDWWATHACMVTPAGYGYWHPADVLLSRTVCPSGQGDGSEIHWALPAGVRIPSLSTSQSCDDTGGTPWPRESPGCKNRCWAAVHPNSTDQEAPAVRNPSFLLAPVPGICFCGQLTRAW